MSRRLLPWIGCWICCIYIYIYIYIYIVQSLILLLVVVVVTFVLVFVVCCNQSGMHVVIVPPNNQKITNDNYVKKLQTTI